MTKDCNVFQHYWFNPGLAALRSVEAQILNSKITQLHLQSSTCALDIGVGNGYFSNLLDVHFKLGIDLLPEQLEEAKKFNQHDELQKFDISQKISSGNPIKADLIISNSVLEHTSDPNAAIQNIAKFLIKGGYALITIPLESSIKCVNPGPKQEYSRVMKIFLGHKNMYNKQKWERLFLKHGLNIVESKYYLFSEFAGYMKAFSPFKTILNERVRSEVKLHDHFISEFASHQKELFVPVMKRELDLFRDNSANIGDCLFLVLRK